MASSLMGLSEVNADGFFFIIAQHFQNVFDPVPRSAFGHTTCLDIIVGDFFDRHFLKFEGKLTSGSGSMSRILIRIQRLKLIGMTSVGDPDPHVLGPPGSGPLVRGTDPDPSLLS
jgi:hypothetical protein